MNRPIAKQHRTAKRNMLGLSVLLAILLLDSIRAQAAFNKVTGIDDARIHRVCVSQTHPPFLAVASDNSLYLSDDHGAHFRKQMVLKDQQINDLFIADGEGTTVYVAGSRKGYRIGRAIEQIFTANENEELYFAREHEGTLYAGTSDGLYFADAAVLNWQALPGLRANAVFAMDASGCDLYLACDSGVYLYRSDGLLKRLFVARNPEGEGGITPTQIREDAMAASRLWLGTTKGIYLSNDRGATWQKFYVNGAGSSMIYCLSQYPLDGSHFYLCSDNGFFKINVADGTSSALFEGLPTTRIRWMDFTPEGDIYLATDQGLFKQTYAYSAAVASPSTHGLEDIMRGEPTIQEVQDAAMRHNAVDPDKTGRWRKRIKYRAIMPRVSVDYDKTIGSSFTSSGYYYAQGPYDWGVTLTWDMGDLIWNSYEDDIDNRTKLTTQLRMDILDDVNRLYFERLRLKHEILIDQGNHTDTILKELRLNELTATLDGYTGGLYTRAAL